MVVALAVFGLKKQEHALLTNADNGVLLGVHPDMSIAGIALEEEDDTARATTAGCDSVVKPTYVVESAKVDTVVEHVVPTLEIAVEVRVRVKVG